MSSQPQPALTSSQYLALERQSEIRHEFLRGEIFVMGGASRIHNQICFNLNTEIGQQFKQRDCTAYASDMRVLVDRTGLYTYPDLVITCDEPEFEDREMDTLLNPQVIIEVLSDSTEKYDRGAKFRHYRELDSIREYILVSQNQPLVEQYVRQENNDWLLKTAEGLDATFELESARCKLDLRDICAKVKFEESTESPRE